MNPILLKPSGNGTSQVVVNGRVWKTLSAREYYAHADELRAKVLEAYEDLASRFDVIVIEGAGSVTELNLRDHDLVNLGLVTRIRAPWLLVADIERGGVFGSVIGTAHLLSADERSLFRGFAINKFRGDVSLFDEGVRILEERTGVPLLRRVSRTPPTCSWTPRTAWRCRRGRARRRRRARDSRSSASRTSRTPPTSGCSRGRTGSARRRAERYDFIILPGSKNTIADLAWLREVGLADWILDAASPRRDGHRHLRRLPDAGTDDPRSAGMESAAAEAEGLGLLPAVTRSQLARSGRGRSRRRLPEASGSAATRSISVSRRSIGRRCRAVRAAGRWRRRRRPSARASSARICTARSSTPTCAPKSSASTRRRRCRRRASISGWPRGSSSTRAISINWASD